MISTVNARWHAGKCSFVLGTSSGHTGNVFFFNFMLLILSYVIYLLYFFSFRLCYIFIILYYFILLIFIYLINYFFFFTLLYFICIYLFILLQNTNLTSTGLSKNYNKMQITSANATQPKRKLN